ncbi:unnamed protein product [Moneuplotes crassus]|uniref:Thioredoxin domain-containing protein n=1 Tax=Euplotes crassus TaxID=5936 RepID=A0AAD1X630_EUPCR|nr:unnamed protein product [Moneuplotes crassus]
MQASHCRRVLYNMRRMRNLRTIRLASGFNQKSYFQKSMPLLGLALGAMAIHHYSKPAFCEENSKKEESVENELEVTLDNFEELTSENITEVMNSRDTKFIYYYNKETTSPEYMKAVNEHANKMSNGLRCKCYALDVEQNGDALKEYLSTRNMTSKLEDEIDNNCFILANGHDDIWFWDDTLMSYFHGELLEQVMNFYTGVRVLHDEHELMITMTENDNHFVVFCKDDTKENDKKLKNLRRFQTKNTDGFLKIKFWVLRDEKLAKQLGIDTDSFGDIYVLKACNQYNQLEATTNLNGKDIYSMKVTNILDTSKATDLYVDIVSVALAFPIIVNDFMSFAQLFSKYQSPSLIVYCDKKDPNFKNILSETFKARQNFPLKIAKRDPGANPNHDLKNNLLFIVSTQPMLIPLLKLADKSPRVILAMPEYDQNDIYDLRDHQWKNLKKIDGFTAEEFYKRVAEKSELKKAKNDDEKESAKAKFSEDRFKFSKAYSFSGKINCEKINTFIEAVQKNKVHNYFESEPVPEETHAERIVGEDLKKKVLLSDHDCVVLVENPNMNENRGYEKKYENYVKKQKDKDVKFYRIKSFNETDIFTFKGYSTPTVLYFKSEQKDKPAELDIKKDLVMGSANKQAYDRIEGFVRENK